MRIHKLLAVSALTGALVLTGCKVEQTREGEAPDVEIEGGQAPEFDVEGPDVDVGTDTTVVTTPDVDVDAPE